MKSIEDIRVGDLVVSRDEAAGRTVLKPVVRLFRRQAQAIIHVSMEDETGKLETLGATPEYPFYVAERGFIKAEQLKPGMTVTRWQPQAAPLQTVGFRAAERASGHLIVKAITITRSGARPWRAYNLTIAADHTYFVGRAKAWVHNACPKVFKKIKYNGRNDDDVLADLNAATKNRPAGGQWELSGEARHGPGSAYEHQVTGVPKAYAYQVNGVKFDGVRNGTLLDAKDYNFGEQVRFIDPGTKNFYEWFGKGDNGVIAQARRQVAAAGGTPVEWIIKDERLRSAYQDLLNRSKDTKHIKVVGR